MFGCRDETFYPLFLFFRSHLCLCASQSGLLLLALAYLILACLLDALGRCVLIVRKGGGISCISTCVDTYILVLLSIWELERRGHVVRRILYMYMGILLYNIGGDSGE